MQPEQQARLKQAALVYVQRYPSSSKRLTDVLKRKLEKWQEPLSPAWLDYIATTLIPELQKYKLVDDAAYAKALAHSYTRKGYARVDAARRAQHLGVALPETDDKKALLYYLKRKRLPPFGETVLERPKLLQKLYMRGFQTSLVAECLAMDEADALELLAE